MSDTLTQQYASLKMECHALELEIALEEAKVKEMERLQISHDRPVKRSVATWSIKSTVHDAHVSDMDPLDIAKSRLESAQQRLTALFYQKWTAGVKEEIQAVSSDRMAHIEAVANAKKAILAIAHEQQQADDAVDATLKMFAEEEMAIKKRREEFLAQSANECQQREFRKADATFQLEQLNKKTFRDVTGLHRIVDGETPISLHSPHGIPPDADRYRDASILRTVPEWIAMATAEADRLDKYIEERVRSKQELP